MSLTNICQDCNNSDSQGVTGGCSQISQCSQGYSSLKEDYDAIFEGKELDESLYDGEIYYENAELSRFLLPLKPNWNNW